MQGGGLYMAAARLGFPFFSSAMPGPSWDRTTGQWSPFPPAAHNCRRLGSCSWLGGDPWIHAQWNSTRGADWHAYEHAQRRNPETAAGRNLPTGDRDAGTAAFLQARMWAAAGHSWPSGFKKASPQAPTADRMCPTGRSRDRCIPTCLIGGFCESCSVVCCGWALASPSTPSSPSTDQD